MRVLFLPMAWPSHYYPMVPLAWAFRGAGHDVRVAAQPTAVESVTASGLPAVPVGGSYDLMAGLAQVNEAVRRQGGQLPSSFQALRELPPAELRRFIELRTAPHVHAAEAMADDLAALIRVWRPDLVVADPMVMVAPLVAELAGARLVRHLWGPQVPSLLGSPGAGAPVDQWPEDLRKLFDRFGAEVREEYSSGTVDPTPASLQSQTVPHRLACRYVPYNGPGEVPDWLLYPAERPRVGMSWTTSNRVQLGADSSPVRDTVRALSALDAEIVLTVRAADRPGLGELPERVRVVAEVPLQLLMPSCVVAVHHGGAGSMLTAACFGVPQVIVPQAPDQMLNAERLAAAGAGVTLPAEAAGPEAVLAAVEGMLTEDRWAAGAARLADEIAGQPAPARVVAELSAEG
ncbi:nucleotide disphospho-sugar-binding domain-containing protein [Micromonospora sp. NPDC050495]|uniref:nucleotide disphospho-sugar-binding domain-containing protein n=1 Tax=Micromonospora sp. NPDC050495 TaxID=3154936 RepID=UPI0033DF05CB